MRRSVVFFAVCFLILGCATAPYKIETTRSVNMKGDYSSVMLSSFISTMSTAYNPLAASISPIGNTPVKDGNVLITPPVEYHFTISSESRMFTSILFNELMKREYILREGVLDPINNEKGGRQMFSIKQATVSEMREQYKVAGLIVGDVVFYRNTYGTLTVCYAQARLLDTETLEIMQAVTYSKTKGETMDIVARRMADMLKYGKEQEIK